ncbi:MAG: SRPBCC family protein [Ilumatobacteraceae bacterium]
MTDTTLTITAIEERAILIRRSFAAPRHLVYEAFTTPALVRRWLGPAAWPMTACEIDLRIGGAWRYEMHGPDGAVMVMQGVYQELDPPSRIVTTETFDDDWTGGETLNTTVFDDVGGGTEVTITVVYPSPEARDGALASGMERGLAEGFDRLTSLLSTATTDGGRS